MASKPRDVSGLQLYSEHENPGDTRYRTYIARVQETDSIRRTYLLCERTMLHDDPGSKWHKPHKAGDLFYNTHVITEQKFLCVGGPMNSERRTEKEATDYALYNRSARTGLRKDDRVKCVLIWKDILK